MAWRPHGRAEVDPENPAAWATCMRCGLNYNLFRLSNQQQWAGKSLISLNLYVCPTCLDKPAPFLRTLVLPPDPPPVFNARPEPYSIDETSYREVDGSESTPFQPKPLDTRITESEGIPRVTECDFGTATGGES